MNMSTLDVGREKSHENQIWLFLTEKAENKNLLFLIEEINQKLTTDNGMEKNKRNEKSKQSWDSAEFVTC